MLQEPSAGRARIAHSLLCGESFRGNQEKRRFGVKLLECFDDIGAIHVGDKVHAQAGLRIGLQGSADHLGTQIRAADADIDHVGDALAGVTLPFTRTHGLAELAHFHQHAAYLWHDVFAIHVDGNVGLIAQSGMQNGTVFG